MPARTEVERHFFNPVIDASLDHDPFGPLGLTYAVDFAEHGVVDPYVHTKSRSSRRTELLIIDEADRHKSTDSSKSVTTSTTTT